MSAPVCAHHMVVASVVRENGTRVSDAGWVGSHYCSLGEIGVRSVRKMLAERYPGLPIHVEIDRSVNQFVATIGPVRP